MWPHLLTQLHPPEPHRYPPARTTTQGLKPTDPSELLKMQNKELNNGRLAMIAVAGMTAEELASGVKLFA